MLTQSPPSCVHLGTRCTRPGPLPRRLTRSPRPPPHPHPQEAYAPGRVLYALRPGATLKAGALGLAAEQPVGGRGARRARITDGKSVRAKVAQLKSFPGARRVKKMYVLLQQVYAGQPGGKLVWAKVAQLKSLPGACLLAETLLSLQ